MMRSHRYEDGPFIVDQDNIFSSYYGEPLQYGRRALLYKGSICSGRDEKSKMTKLFKKNDRWPDGYLGDKDKEERKRNGWRY